MVLYALCSLSYNKLLLTYFAYLSNCLGQHSAAVRCADFLFCFLCHMPKSYFLTDVNDMNVKTHFGQFTSL